MKMILSYQMRGYFALNNFFHLQISALFYNMNWLPGNSRIVIENCRMSESKRIAGNRHSLLCNTRCTWPTLK